MLDHFFRRPHAAARLRAGPHAAHIEAYAAALRAAGYGRNTARDYLWAAARFARWLSRRRVPLADVDEAHARAFVRRRAGSRPATAVRTDRASLGHFLRLLRSAGVTRPAVARPTCPVDAAVEAFDRHLRDVAGMAPLTREVRARHARDFLRSVFGRGPVHWARLRPGHVRRYVGGFGRDGRHATAVVAAATLRLLLGWLRLRGDDCPADLESAIPRVRRWRHADLPRVMSDAQLAAVLAAFDRSAPLGRRDYAVAVCLADLGLRVGEVAALTLDDLDWRAGVVRVPAGKTRRGRVLPLTDRVGRAVADYLRRGRPAAATRMLFVRHTRPAGTPVTRASVTAAVCRAFARAGCGGWKGTHVLRHTAATRMYARGASLKEVADVLGHRCLDTTAIYAKVAADRLAAVALPWPGGGQP